jgi:LysM repeat protein
VTQPATYTVKSGDTLSAIASRFNTTWQNLYNMNKATINNDAAAHNIYSQQYNYIWPGEKLVVP